MTDKAKNLFHAFDQGRLSRRWLLSALGVAMALPSTSAFAQGVCGVGKPGAGTPACDPTPAKLPFEPTGWKTVLLDHVSCQVADYPKEAAYYAALMGWKIRSDDGTQAVLDIGDWGGMVLRGGYQAPSPPPAGGAAPRQGEFDGFCWGIASWNAKKVEAELRKRGLNPVADNHKGFESFHVKDPDGFDLQISNGSRDKRRQHPANGKTSAKAPFEPTNWQTTWLDHISFEVSNYKETVAFYTALLGWTPGIDEGSQNQCEIGDIGDITIRRKRAPAGTTPSATPERGAGISHISFGITPFDPDQVKAELEKRGLMAKEDTGGHGDIHTAPYKSYHTMTPNGFNMQISAATEATRILSSQ